MTTDPVQTLLYPSCAECDQMGAYVPWYLADMEMDLGAEAVRNFLIAHGGRQFVLPVRLPEAERGSPRRGCGSIWAPAMSPCLSGQSP